MSGSGRPKREQLRWPPISSSAREVELGGSGRFLRRGAQAQDKLETCGAGLGSCLGARVVSEENRRVEVAKSSFHSLLAASPHKRVMVLEASVLLIDNSEWMRNGDYTPNRFQVRLAVWTVCALSARLGAQPPPAATPCRRKWTR